MRSFAQSAEIPSGHRIHLEDFWYGFPTVAASAKMWCTRCCTSRRCSACLRSVTSITDPKYSTALRCREPDANRAQCRTVPSGSTILYCCSYSVLSRISARAVRTRARVQRVNQLGSLRVERAAGAAGIQSKQTERLIRVVLHLPEDVIVAQLPVWRKPLRFARYASLFRKACSTPCAPLIARSGCRC